MESDRGWAQMGTDTHAPPAKPAAEPQKIRTHPCHQRLDCSEPEERSAIQRRGTHYARIVVRRAQYSILTQMLLFSYAFVHHVYDNEHRDTTFPCQPRLACWPIAP